MCFISVLIPCRNYDCTALVSELYLQSLYLGCDIEIVVGDDCSTQKIIDFCKIRHSVEDAGFDFVDNKIRIISSMSISDTPIGAGRMRNLLSENAEGEYLLFLDSDVMPGDRHFIKTYIDNIDIDDEKVLVGGFCYDNIKPPKDYLLKYFYGHKIETKPLAYRKANPYTTFVSMNFLIHRNVYSKNTMHNIVSMGYEDALWARMLKDNGVLMSHIDNPVLHRIKETNRQFIDTTYRYVDNLKSNKYYFPQGTVKVLDLYNRIRYIRPLIKLVSKTLSLPLEKFLIRYPRNIKLFLFLKLLRMCN